MRVCVCVRARARVCAKNGAREKQVGMRGEKVTESRRAETIKTRRLRSCAPAPPFLTEYKKKQRTVLC